MSSSTDSARGEPVVERDPAVPEADAGLYIYAIVSSERPPDVEGLKGIANGAVELVPCGPVAAVVSGVSRTDLSPENEQQTLDVGWLETTALAHERVVEACLAVGPVLPLRFGTTLRTRRDLLSLLEERRSAYASELDRLVETREWGVKAFVDAAALASSVSARRGDLVERKRLLESQPPGAAYFGRKRLEEAISSEGERLVAEHAEEAHRRLAGRAMDATMLPVRTQKNRPKDELRLNGAYLVATHAEEAFQTELARLGREQASAGIRYELTGPWPPYTFVSQDLQSQ